VTQVLAGRVALVTGVGRRRGIGFAIAKRLAAQGADLFTAGHAPYDASQPWGADPDRDALVAELRAAGHRVLHAEADLADPAAPARLVEDARRQLGHVDVLVANHAHSGSGALEDLRAEDIDRHLHVNVRATLLLAQAFAAQHEAERAGGRVIWMISGQHRSAMPGELAYVASKGALHQLTRSLAAYLAPRGITVNAVNPGATDTGWAPAGLHEAIRAQHPLGRWGEPDDAARVVAWLASDEARWVTGQIIDSTGGGP
jgi:3-oxoacyl-[acyl-carrier protein] reductase